MTREEIIKQRWENADWGCAVRARDDIQVFDADGSFLFVYAARDEKKIIDILLAMASH